MKLSCAAQGSLRYVHAYRKDYDCIWTESSGLELFGDMLGQRVLAFPSGLPIVMHYTAKNYIANSVKDNLNSDKVHNQFLPSLASTFPHKGRLECKERLLMIRRLHAPQNYHDFV